MGPPRVAALLGTEAWRPWIVPFLEAPDYRLVCPEDGGLPRNVEATVFLSSHESLRRDRERAARAAGTVVAQPEAVVRLAYDKRAMARRARQVEGLVPIPDLTPAAARTLLERGRVRAIVAKRPDGTGGEGMRIFHRPGDLTTTGVRLYEGDYLLQPYLEGEELSVLCAWHAGRAAVLAPVSKGSTRTPLHPILRRRSFPAPLLDDPAWPALREACVAYMAPFEPEGFVELELIRRRDVFFLLEVNPRVPATLRLAAAASASNPFAALLGAAAGLGRLPATIPPAGVAVEWATPHKLPASARRELARLPGVWVSTRITVTARDRTELAARVEELRRRAPQLAFRLTGS